MTDLEEGYKLFSAFCFCLISGRKQQVHRPDEAPQIITKLSWTREKFFPMLCLLQFTYYFKMIHIHNVHIQLRLNKETGREDKPLTLIL